MADRQDLQCQNEKVDLELYEDVRRDPKGLDRVRGCHCRALRGSMAAVWEVVLTMNLVPNPSIFVEHVED